MSARTTIDFIRTADGKPMVHATHPDAIYEGADYWAQ